jgi:hypothetical protein
MLLFFIWLGYSFIGDDVIPYILAGLSIGVIRLIIDAILYFGKEKEDEY